MRSTLSGLACSATIKAMSSWRSKSWGGLPVSDIRGHYWLEATDNIRDANSLDISDPEFWACWLSALVNATMAAIPDSVMHEVDFLTANRNRIQKDVQDSIKEKLNA